MGSKDDMVSVLFYWHGKDSFIILWNYDSPLVNVYITMENYHATI